MTEQKQQRPETDEIAILEHDLGIFQGFLNVLENPDKVLRLEAGGDITVYDDIGREPRIGSNLRTRAQAVIGKEWEVLPAGDDKRDMDIAAYVKEVFLSFPFDAARRAILRGGVLKGYSVAEIMWDSSEGDISILEMKHRSQRRFRFDMKGDLRLLTATDGMEGINLSKEHPRKFQTFVFGDEPETPYGVGLGRELYWPWWFKKNGIKFWLQFCERFGSPTAIGKYPGGSTPDKKATLHNAIEAIRRNASITIPEGMSIELLQAAASGSVSTHSEMVRYMDELCSICILGQAASTQGTPGRLGSDESQENVREDLVKADSDALTEYLNYQVVRFLVDYQFPGHKRYPRMWIRAGEEADLNQMATRDKTLREAGVLFKKNYFIGAYGFKEDEFEIQADVNQESPTAFASRMGSSAFFALGDPAVVDNQIGQLGLESEQAIQAMLDTVRGLIEEAGSLEELLDKILDAYPGMDAKSLAEIMAKGMASADLLGRYEILENVNGD